MDEGMDMNMYARNATMPKNQQIFTSYYQKWYEMRNGSFEGKVWRKMLN